MIHCLVQGSTQNSAHHAAGYVRHHHDMPVQAVRQSSGVLRRKYNSLWCHLHKVDLGCPRRSLKTAIKGYQRAGLTTDTNQKIGIIGINFVVRYDSASIQSVVAGHLYAQLHPVRYNPTTRNNSRANDPPETMTTHWQGSIATGSVPATAHT